LIAVRCFGAKGTERPALTDAEVVASMKSHVAWTAKYATADQTPDH
jgi:hypothetical protein